MKKSTKLTIFSFLFFCFFILSQNIWAQVSGVKKIPGDYPTLTAALQHFQTVGIAGPVFIELQDGYNASLETFPIKIRNFPGSANPLFIGPAAEAKVTIFSTLPGAVIEFIGATNVVIDGRDPANNTDRNLTIRNLSQTGNAIAFLDGAVDNSVLFCKVENVSTGHSFTDANQSVILFGRSNEPLPAGVFFENVNNTIGGCRIEGLNGPHSLIYAHEEGQVQTGGNKIMDNELLSFFESGINIDFSGGGNWVITGNSIYNEDSNYATTQRGISFSPGENSFNNSIIGNFIGGSRLNAGGDKMHTPGMFGIAISHTGSVAVQNNFIQNLRVDKSVSGNATFIGIIVFDQSSAQVKDNIIGGILEENGIELYGIDNIFMGIRTVPCLNISIENNIINHITMQSPSGTQDFNGIMYREGSNTSISGNVISQVTANSTGAINFTAITSFSEFLRICPAGSQPAVFDNNLISNITLSSEDDNASFMGIEIKGAGSELLQLHNNEVYKINVSAPLGIAAFTGLSINDRISANSGNIIGSATEANSIMVTGQSASANGIYLNNSPDVSVSDDIIANITAIGTLTPSSVNGIVFNEGAVAKISGNTLHHLTAMQTKGIFIRPSTGASHVTLDSNTLTGLNTGIGIETLVGSEASLNLTVIENTVSNWQTGVLVEATNAASLQQLFQNNSISENQNGFVNNSNSHVNATCNWWGHASGPGGAGPGTGDPVGSNVIFSPWATIPEFISVNAGEDQIIYTGYGEQSKILTATTISCGAASYLWSNGSTTQSITTSIAGTYQVTVRDANGHVATDEVTVFVKDVRCGNKNDKVMVCHKSGKQNNSLCISANAVAAHLAHGDVLGDCGTITEMVTHEQIEEGLILLTHSNISANSFSIQLKTTNKKDRVKLQVFDVNGRLIEQRDNVNVGSSIHLGNLYKPGIYLIRVQQGKEIKSFKLIK